MAVMTAVGSFPHLFTLNPWSDFAGLTLKLLDLVITGLKPVTQFM